MMKPKAAPSPIATTIEMSNQMLIGIINIGIIKIKLPYFLKRQIDNASFYNLGISF